MNKARKLARRLGAIVVLCLPFTVAMIALVADGRAREATEYVLGLVAALGTLTCVGLALWLWD